MIDGIQYSFSEHFFVLAYAHAYPPVYMIFMARASENDPDHSYGVKKGKMTLFFLIFAPIAAKFGYTWTI